MMKKSLLSLLVAGLFSLPATAFESFTVQDIRVEGIQRTEAGTIFSYLPLKVGDKLTEEKAAQAIKALYATGFFKDVRIEAEGADETRYQTVYAREPGAVAAPTAGLHFDEAMLSTLQAQGVNTAFLTLHVGAGTYRPMRVEKIADHRMHSERFEIPQVTADAIAATRAAGGRVIAVGTTSLRALESAGNDDGTVRVGGAETSIFITPGYRFKVVDRLITNFHLPKSTLLMLVSAFAGYDNIRAAYAHAVVERYRFFSYGDAMLLEKTDAI